MASREDAIRTLESINAAPVFLQLYKGEKVPYDLDIYCGAPEELFSAAETLDVYTKGKLVPVLDDGNFGLIVFYEPSTRTFIQKDVESPSEIDCRFANWQQYLADLMIRMVEAGVEDEELAEIAELIQFKYIDQLLAFAGEEGDDFETDRVRFLATLNA